MKTLVLIDHLAAGYSENLVVDGVSLEAREGDVAAIFGANGSGKSTVLRAILRTARIFEGKISIAGRAVNDLAPHQIAALGVGALPQANSVFPSLTVKENLTVALRSGDRDEVSGRISAVTRLFPEIKPFLNRQAALLSGGERQILGVCRALVTDPEVVILDEPGAGVAPGMLTSMLERIVETVRQNRKALLVVEHNAAATLALADKLLVLRDGKTAYSGGVDGMSLGDLARLMLQAGGA
jgi:branched-chain amino acid transport system ATP-binding protein